MKTGCFRGIGMFQQVKHESILLARKTNPMFLFALLPILFIAAPIPAESGSASESSANWAQTGLGEKPLFKDGFESCAGLPTAVAASVGTIEEQSLLITLEGMNAVAVDFEIIDFPTLGQLSPLTPIGPLTSEVTYSPDPNEFGDDTLTFRVLDGNCHSVPALIDIEIAPVNDPPSFIGGYDLEVFAGGGSRSYTRWIDATSPGPINEAGQTVSIEVASNSNPGLFATAPSITGDGTLSIDPLPGASGVATIDVRAVDDGGTTNGGQNQGELYSFVTTVSQARAFPPPGTSQSDLDEAMHILNRLTFGPTVELIEQILSQGIDGWIKDQLAPIPEPELEAWLSLKFDADSSFEELTREWLIRAQRSQNQLLEVMVLFWEEHFFTGQLQDVGAEAERTMQDQFRQYALGSFGDLLNAVARSPTTLIAYGNVGNGPANPNLSFARWLLENASLGLNNGYTESDVVEVARCFTGWTVVNGAFAFDPSLHDPGTKTPLGLTIPSGGGVEDGELVLVHLAQQSAAADFLAFRLLQRFVDLNPPVDITLVVSTALSGSGGDVQTGMMALLTHARFRSDPAYRSNLLRSPVEYTLAVARMTEAPPRSDLLFEFMAARNALPFSRSGAVRWNAEEEPWGDAGDLEHRWQFLVTWLTNRGATGTALGWSDFSGTHLTASGSTSDDLLDTIDALTTHGLEPAGRRAILESFLTGDNPGGFTLTPAVVDVELRNTLILALMSPEMQRR